jgi:preprotein translocase subunit SecF
MVRYGEQPGGEPGQQAALRRVRALIDADYEVRRTEVVGPTVSSELVQMSVIGVILSILAVLVYLWFRFEWQFAVAAMIATLHDVTAIMAFYIFTQADFDITSIASVLTIIGYSLNDTVVVFDRIREMMRKHKKLPVAELLDVAINSTLSRTTITATTTFLALLGLFFFGGEVIQGFTASMLVGVIVGTYSSIFIAAPILIYLGLRQGGFGTARADGGGGAREPRPRPRPDVPRGEPLKVLHEGFVPGRFAIDAYGRGGFRFADMSHRGSILALPSGVHAWNRRKERR